MVKYTTLTISLFTLLAFLLTACQRPSPPFECTDSIGCVDIAPGQPVKLGILQTIGGGAVALGRTQLRTMELAIGEKGEILGHPIELLTEDSRCSPEGGTTAALKIVSDPMVVGILGTSCPGSAVTASKVMSKAGLVMISSSNSTPSLTAIAGKKGKDWQPGYFRTNQNNFAMTEALAKIAWQEFGITRAATINDGDPHTRGLTKFFGLAFREIGGEIVLATTITRGEKTVTPVLDAVAASGAELLFFPLFPPQGDLIVFEAKKRPALAQLQLFTTTSLLTNDFVRKLGRGGVTLHFISQALPETIGHRQLLGRFIARYGHPPQHGTTYPRAYEAANLLMHAIEAVAATDADGTLHIGRQALRDALYATRNFQGVTGKINCDEFGDCGVSQYVLLRADSASGGVAQLKSRPTHFYSGGFWQQGNMPGTLR